MLGNGQVEWVDDFPYLGFLIHAGGRIHEEVDRRIACASRAFGALKRPVFGDADLSVTTKWRLACVLSVLLYESECWVPLRGSVLASTFCGSVAPPC